MRALMKPILVAFGLVLSTACARAPASTVSQSGQAAALAARPTRTSPAGTASPPGRGSVRGFETLGGACAPQQLVEIHGARARLGCNERGIVAQVEWPLADVVGEPEPSDVIARRVQAGPSTETLAVTQDAVWMRVSDSARRVRGSTWMGLIAEMTDAQRAAAQLRAGLPGQPLLRTGDEWKRALVDHGPKPPPASP